MVDVGEALGNADAFPIPCEETTWLGHLFCFAKADGPAPVIIVHHGRDGWVEDNKHLADAAIHDQVGATTIGTRSLFDWTDRVF